MSLLDFLREGYFEPDGPQEQAVEKQTAVPSPTTTKKLSDAGKSLPIQIPGGVLHNFGVSKTSKTKSTAKPALQEDILEEDFEVDEQKTAAINSGLSGAYVVRNSFGGEGIFKPSLEESTRSLDDLDGLSMRASLSMRMSIPDSPLPPNSAPGKNGVVFGQAAMKECAAYVLDQASPMPVGVPRTRMASALVRGEKKRGSLQSLFPHKCSAEDMGPSSFDNDQVHWLGIFDIRILNLDRHLGNILVADVEVPVNGGARRSTVDVPTAVTRPSGGSTIPFKPSSRSSSFQTQPLLGRDYTSHVQGRDSTSADGSVASCPGRRLVMVPIDHGFTFPSFRDHSDVYLGWQYWRHCKQPFSDETKERIRLFNPLTDGLLLATQALLADAVVGSVFATILVMHTAEDTARGGLGLNLFQMAQLVQRKGPKDEDLTVLESALNAVNIDGAVQEGAAVLPWLGGAHLPTPGWLALVARFKVALGELASARLAVKR